MVSVLVADNTNSLEDFVDPYCSCLRRDFVDREDALDFEQYMRGAGFDTLVWTYELEGDD